jgi:branched-chain amino acid transport system permease protein
MKKLHWILAIAFIAFMLIAPAFMKNYGIYMMSLWLVFVVATMGLNLTVGYAGQKSLGQAAFFGIGCLGI